MTDVLPIRILIRKAVHMYKMNEPSTLVKMPYDYSDDFLDQQQTSGGGGGGVRSRRRKKTKKKKFSTCASVKARLNDKGVWCVLILVCFFFLSLLPFLPSFSLKPSFAKVLRLTHYTTLHCTLCFTMQVCSQCQICACDEGEQKPNPKCVSQGLELERAMELVCDAKFIRHCCCHLDL